MIAVPSVGALPTLVTFGIDLDVKAISRHAFVEFTSNFVMSSAEIAVPSVGALPTLVTFGTVVVPTEYVVSVAAIVIVLSVVFGVTVTLVPATIPTASLAPKVVVPTFTV